MEVYERDGRWYGEAKLPSGATAECDLEYEAGEHVLTVRGPVKLPTDETSAKYILLLRQSREWRQRVRWTTGI